VKQKENEIMLKLPFKVALVLSLLLMNITPSVASQSVGDQISQDLNTIFGLIKSFNAYSDATDENSTMEDLRKGPAHNEEIFPKLRVALKHYNKVLTANWKSLPVKNNALFPARETLLDLYTQTSNWANVASTQESLIYKTFAKCYALDTFDAYAKCVNDFPNSAAIVKAGKDKELAASQRMVKPVTKFQEWSASVKKSQTKTP